MSPEFAKQNGIRARAAARGSSLLAASILGAVVCAAAQLVPAQRAMAQDKLDVSGGFFEKDMVNKDLFEGIDNGGGRKKRNLSQGIPDYNHQPPRKRRRRSFDSFAVDSRELGSALGSINGANGNSYGSSQSSKPRRSSVGLEIIPDLSSQGGVDAPGIAPHAAPAPASDQFSVGGSPDLSSTGAEAPAIREQAPPDTGILNGQTLEQKAQQIAAHPEEAQSSAAEKAIAAGLTPGTPEYTQYIVDQVVDRTQGAKQNATGGGSWRDRAQQNRANAGASRF